MDALSDRLLQAWWTCHAHTVRVKLLTRLGARQEFLPVKLKYLPQWLLIFDPLDIVVYLKTIYGQMHGKIIQYMGKSKGETIRKVSKI